LLILWKRTVVPNLIGIIDIGVVRLVRGGGLGVFILEY